jgi:plasmid stabilization system protein ParE
VKIEILDDAEADLIEGFHFYEGQEAGLGWYFLDSLFSDIDSLLLYAGTHHVVHGYHRCLAKRFPFAAYYLLEGEMIRVYAVLDCRRNPSWIQKRLKSPNA